MNSEWSYLSASQLLTQLKNGSITSRALLETYISRINEKNPSINAIVAMDLTQARARADAAEIAALIAKFKFSLYKPISVVEVNEKLGLTLHFKFKKLHKGSIFWSILFKFL